MPSKPNGYILHETSDVVVIATGINNKSTNTKTGNMIQIYILCSNVDPVTASRTGQDAAICFDCPMRGTSDGETVTGRACYVTLFHGPLAVYRAYQNGNYPKLSITDAASVFTGRTVRYGAYGDTCLIPKVWYRAISAVASGWTGYTHQWQQSKFAWLSQFVMASVESSALQAKATLAGWRTFRVAATDAALPGEVNCPASIEAGKRTTCEHCQLCMGTSKQAKNVYIQAHGNGSKSAFAIIQ
jgi:hypothetical protein